MWSPVIELGEGMGVGPPNYLYTMGSTLTPVSLSHVVEVSKTYTS